jgi:hypothetical protein
MPDIKSLWVVLIDHSGSMGDGFFARSQFRGETERGDYSTKLDAAKNVLFIQIESLVSARDVAVIEFTGDASLLFKCSRESAHQYRSAVYELRAEDGTDIAKALDFARNQLREWEHYDLVRFLVISDGLSDVDEAHKAARQCFAKGIFIDMVLIDPSPEGESMAQAISLGGRVTSVTSTTELESAIAEERVAFEEDIALARKRVERESVAPRRILQWSGILGILVAIATIMSLTFGVFSGISSEHKVFQGTVLFGIGLLFLGGYFIYLAQEEREQHPLFVNPRNVRMISVLRRTGRKRTLLLIGGSASIVLGLNLIVSGAFYAPDSPFVPTPTPTSTPTSTPTLTPTNTPTQTPTPTLTPTNTPTPTRTSTSTATITQMPSPTLVPTNTPLPTATD